MLDPKDRIFTNLYEEHNQNKNAYGEDAGLSSKLNNNEYQFIDLFAGIGGFHLAFHNIGAKCVYASEIDPHARKTYEANFKSLSPELFQNDLFNNDITNIIDPVGEIPDFDILCAGFPCQPFSQAGYKRGFSEERDGRGNMFFIISRIIHAKRPKAIFLENVRHLLKHDNGRTFSIIQKILKEELGYKIYWKIVKASDFGLPQHRPRLFIVGFREEDNYSRDFTFPEPVPLSFTMSEVLKGKCSRDIGYTLRVGGRHSGLNDRRNWDTYLVDGKARRLVSSEGKKMMGYPDDFIFPVTETQAMKQLGNSVAVSAIQKTAESIVDYLKSQSHFQENACNE